MKVALTILAMVVSLTLGRPALAVDQISCDLTQYQAQVGLSASIEREAVLVSWNGEEGAELRMTLGIDGGQPIIRELALRQRDGQWKTLGQDLSPEFNVTTGLRRISEQQINPLRQLGVELTPELLEREKWKVFWDAPLRVPGVDGINPGMPRQPSEIQRNKARYDSRECKVKSNGARLEISFSGLTMGVFSGRLQFTVYRGTNLVRQEAIAKTEEPSVAYKYSGGLEGLRTEGSRVIWRDTGGNWQKYEFGGSPNSQPVALRARNRLAIVENEGGSIAVFPPPHKFFWAREIELNLGYVWYRKDDGTSFSVGVRHGDYEEMFRPYGFSDQLWERRVRQSRRFALGNFAMYNAPPGTWQRMAVYYYLSLEDGQDTQKSVLAFTHNDQYKAISGYKVAISHFHTHFAEELTDGGSFDIRPAWIPAFRALGINIAMMSDFHGDGHPSDPGPLRLREQNDYFEACRRHSDKDFLIIPGEEPNAHFGGHYTMVFPRPVYWTKVRQEGQGFTEIHSQYGTVYHTGSAAEELEMLKREGGLIWQAHPRTKGSTLYPDSIRETSHFLSDRYLGVAFQSLPVDQSEARICETRCFETLDDMNNWTGPKYLVAEGDTYTKYPDDEIYGELVVNYIKLDRLPKFDEDWSSITRALRAGNSFVTTGEVLFRNFEVEGSGTQRKVVADVEWTFPLEFVEIVWGDGKTTDRQIISATDQPPFGSFRFSIPFDVTNKKWVRFAVWDSAGNGAAVQPVHLNP